MKRLLAPEILDELPAADPAAVRSRRDLQRVNWWMGNARWLASALLQHSPQPPARMLELGAGDATLMLEVARRLAPKWQTRVELFLLDRQDILDPQTRAGFTAFNWTPAVLRRELADWIGRPEPHTCEVIIANLFLHHFPDDFLRSLFDAISKTAPLFIACEPKRWRMSLLSARLLRLIGCNHVTRHDARVSIRAGFRDRELTGLWPRNSGHRLTEGPAGLASHLFVARKPGA